MESPLTPDKFAQIANVSRETLARLQAYADLLAKWQGTVNLVSRATLADLWRRHMLDSAQLARHLPEGATALTDLGSGAGFPGLVLAIVTGLPVELVESDVRKSAFLREAARLTDAPATVTTARIESLAAVRAPAESRGGEAGGEKKPVDIITARALAPLATLCEMVDSLRPRACVFLKGANWREELTEARKSWTMQAESFDSLTSPDGCILRLSGVARIAGPDVRPPA